MARLPQGAERVSRNNPCPVCGGKDKGCWKNAPRQDKSGKEYISVHCAVIESEKCNPNESPTTWTHYLYTGTYSSYTKTVDIIKPKEQEFASPEKCDRVYRWVINNLFKLKPEDRESLTKKGIRNLESFGSIRKSLREFSRPYHGPNPSGVPGFFKNNKGDWHVVTPANGILYPSIIDGLIRGFQIRADKGGGKKEYKWLTSAGGINRFGKPYTLDCGTPATATPHEEWPDESRETPSRAWITEGLAKAQSIADYYKEYAISVPGVGNWTRAMQRIRELGIKEVVIAFDMDFLTKKEVAAPLEALQSDAQRDMTVYQARWNPKHKGIDDAILAGDVPQVVLKHTPKYLALAEAQEKLFQQAIQLLQKKEPGFHLIKTTVGSSKTTSMVKALNFLHDNGQWPRVDVPGKLPGLDTRPAVIVFLVDNKQQAYDVKKGLSFNAPILMGRSDEEGSAFWCSQIEKCHDAGAAGHNVIRSVCQFCPYKTECEEMFYLGTKQLILDSSRFIIATKPAFLNDTSRLEKVDIVITDESIHQFLFPTKSINIADIDRLITTLRIRAYQDEMAFIELECLKEAILNGPRQAEAFDVSNIKTTLHEDFTRSWVNRDGHTVFPKDIFKMLREGRSTVSITNRELLMCPVPQKMLAELKEKIVINLDATPFDSLLGIFQEKKTHAFDVKQHIYVHQTRDAKYSKSELAQNEYKNRAFKAVKALCEEGKKVVVLGPQKTIKEFQPHLPSSVDVGWYGNHTKATNRFAKHDRIVIVGDYMVNIGTLDMYRRAASEFCNTEIPLHSLIQESREAEICQAIGRGRGTLRTPENPLEVFLITNVPFEKISINRSVAKTEMLYKQDEPVKDTVIKKASAESIQLASANLAQEMRSQGKKPGADSSAIRMEAYYLANSFQLQNKSWQRIADFFRTEKLNLSNIYSSPAQSDWEKIQTTAARAALTGYKPEHVTDSSFKKFYSITGKAWGTKSDAIDACGLSDKTFNKILKSCGEALRLREAFVSNWSKLITDYFVDRISETWLSDGFERIWDLGLLKGEPARDLSLLAAKWLDLIVVQKDLFSARLVEDQFFDVLRRYPMKIHFLYLDDMLDVSEGVLT